MVIWLTGLSGAGKTTLATELEKKIIALGHHVILLDGDIIRNGLNSNLGFTEQDRIENIRRAAEVAKLFNDKGFSVICSFITPLNRMRALAKAIIGVQNFTEVFVDCSIETCEKRDIKGLYKKVRLKQIDNFTGISAGFEKPIHHDLVIDTEKNSVEYSTGLLLDFYVENLKKNK